MPSSGAIEDRVGGPRPPDKDDLDRMNLSDQGIAKELEKHGRQGLGSLAIEPEVKTPREDDREQGRQKDR